MNRRSEGSMPISKAITGFVNYKMAEGLSRRTVDSYQRVLTKWIEHQGDKLLHEVTPNDIRSYLSWLRTDYQPKRKNGKTHPLSRKTIRNVWVTLASFFRWASMEFGVDNPVDSVPAPRIQRKPVEAFTKEDVDALLKACEYSRKADTSFRQSFVMRRPTARRDRAIILTLLDTGLRASELCALTVGDVDLKVGRVEVAHGTMGKAKGGKGRTVFLGKVARKAVWRYLATREDGDDPTAPLFTNKEDRPMNPTSLRLLIKRLAEKAGVKNAYPHKFRHTFAITYLRSGGDVFTLQALLGHSTLDMVRHYAQIAEVDIQKAHRKASPADNWRL
ncbi:hypothetical protein D6779_04985 [Candidatus Parcubacteria bacterium]|nr:MAG: hypothetical protein D6779_04985 [Candidatus Parcubacteria bacterium]